MQSLVEEIITVDNEKCELVYPDKSIILNISQTFWLSGSWSKDQKHWFFNRTILHNFLAFDWDLDGRNQPYSYWLIIIWMLIKIIINSTLCSFMTIRILMQGTKSILLQWNKWPLVENFRLRCTVEIQTCIFAETSFKIKEIQFKCFLALSQCRYYRTIWCSRHFLEKECIFAFG